MELQENLGKLGKDKITGFKGIVNAYIVYLTGCNQYGLVSQKLKSDGSTLDIHWFDVDRIEIIGKGIQKKEVTNRFRPGGPQDHPQGKNG
ncbi:MAG TPA: hypothetical protein VFD46_14210 [Chryseolinea sp.]|nr:hypothetical protein [Chryseolinea sp.]